MRGRDRHHLPALRAPGGRPRHLVAAHDVTGYAMLACFALILSAFFVFGWAAIFGALKIARRAQPPAQECCDCRAEAMCP